MNDFVMIMTIIIKAMTLTKGKPRLSDEIETD